MQVPAGCVVAAAQGPRYPQARVLKQHVRGSMTYISLICDCKEVQGKLPHYLIATKTKLTKKLLRAQQALPQTRLKVFSQKSAWCSADNLVEVFQGIAEALKAFPSKKAIVLLDCAPAHLPQRVMQAARKRKLQLAYIPAQTTDFLQPLDLCAFSGFKQFLRVKYQEQRSHAEHGLIDPLAWIWQLMQCPRDYFAARSWRNSFLAVGCNAPKVQNVHKELQRLMDFPLTFPGSEKPTAKELACVWPERRRMPYAHKALF